MSFVNMVDPSERNIQRELFCAVALCIIAISPCLLSFVSDLKPKSEHIDLWFQRSGAVMTAIAVFAQVKASNLMEMIRGSTFAESWVMYKKYKNYQRAVNLISTMFVIVGTVIWGYGDLLIQYPWLAPMKCGLPL